MPDFLDMNEYLEKLSGIMAQLDRDIKLATDPVEDENAKVAIREAFFSRAVSDIKALGTKVQLPMLILPPGVEMGDVKTVFVDPDQNAREVSVIAVASVKDGKFASWSGFPAMTDKPLFYLVATSKTSK